MASEDSSSSRSSESPLAESPLETSNDVGAGTMATTYPKAKRKDSSSSKKRTSSISDPNGTTKVTKRRAARACVSCRARKVRCDVVEGAPCGNCRWDKVECVVQESRRRKKPYDPNSSVSHNIAAPRGAEAHLKAKVPATPVNIACAASAASLRRPSEIQQPSTIANDANDPTSIQHGTAADTYVPHLLYQQAGVKPDPILLSNLEASNNGSRYPSIWPHPQPGRAPHPSTGNGALRTEQIPDVPEQSNPAAQVPAFIKPLPAKVAPEDVSYLRMKGALSLPSLPLQTALLRAYVEFVHPYMPLIDLHDFLGTIAASEGPHDQISLFLYQSVMFAATAYVDVRLLRDAGFPTRKLARKVFFYKARLLYDFDYESDRLLLVQGLLLMTYWYETPDDQKDTWHWMGVAISLAHTIGLHRDPAQTAMSLDKQRLWKRIWWSCFMRDQLVALGMRRPTRIKDEDFDVPMLEKGDFEIEQFAGDISVVGAECTLVRDVVMQQELALMCIAKAKLCLCVSHVLKAQYSVLIRDKVRPEDTTNSTMMLLPNKNLDNAESIRSCDDELTAWSETLPPCCSYQPLSHSAFEIQNGRATLAIQRNLLHMIYYATISALHRPQFLPSSPLQIPQTSAQLQELSRMKVRDAALHITSMVVELSNLQLDHYLPTTGVTVILPAMIIHLLEMKNPIPEARDAAMRGFHQCMRVMDRLRDVYSAADYAVGFLDAALRKAATDLHTAQMQQGFCGGDGGSSGFRSDAPPGPPLSASVAGIEDMATPPPEHPMLATADAFDPSPAAHTQQFIPPVNIFAFAQYNDVATADHGYGDGHQRQHMQQHQHQQHPQMQTQRMQQALHCQSPTHADRDMYTPSVSGSPDHHALPPDLSNRGQHSDQNVPTPSASGSSDSPAAMLDAEMDLDEETQQQQQNEFDWAAAAGANLDFDQWVDFQGAGLVTMNEVDNGMPAGIDFGYLPGDGA
ncbi:fungal-specific transcription factor domain-containing protein [Xylariaceae sp. FL0804]|nr:fungal-specific transcription factor domain-containing protein [Xylariaceae sp. FL0804]